LSRPDAFTQSVKKLFDGLASNKTLIVIFGGMLLAIGLGTGVWMNRRENKSMEAQNALFSARKSGEDQYKAIAAKLPPTIIPANPKVKDSKVQTVPANIDQVEYRKLDVDAEFGPTLEKYREVANRFAGTRAAFDAKLSVGDLYFDHGEPAKAVAWYKQAVDAATGGFERAMSLYSYGYSLAASGQHRPAVDAYAQALKLGEAGLKAELMLATARAWEAAKDMGQAKAAYDQIISQLPNTDAARTAEAQKARLQ